MVFPDDNADGSSGINPDLASRKEAEIKSLNLKENLPLAELSLCGSHKFFELTNQLPMARWKCILGQSIKGNPFILLSGIQLRY